MLAIFISSWGQAHLANPYGSACASMDSRRRPATVLMSTIRATALSPIGGCISSFGSSKPVTDRIFEIEFMDPGVEVFAFTFG
jgi:hypothetical protein